MKRFVKWIQRHRDLILRGVFCIPIVLSIVVSINHCITFFAIANPPAWAYFLSISVEVAAASTLVALMIGRPGMHIYLPFFLITFTQVIGNIFFSFDYINETSPLFTNWKKFMVILFPDNEWDNDKYRFWLSVIEGSIVPMLSLLSLHLIAKFQLKEDNNSAEPVIEKPAEPVVIPQPVVAEIVSEPVKPIEPVIEEKSAEPVKTEEPPAEPAKPVLRIEDFIATENEPNVVQYEEEEEEIEEPLEEIPDENVETEEPPAEPEPEEEIVTEEEVPEEKEVKKFFYEDMGKSDEAINRPKRSLFPRIKVRNK